MIRSHAVTLVLEQALPAATGIKVIAVASARPALGGRDGARQSAPSRQSAARRTPDSYDQLMSRTSIADRAGLVISRA